MLLGHLVDKAGENTVYTNLAQNSSVPLLGFQNLSNITWVIVAVGLCLSIISPLNSEKFDEFIIIHHCSNGFHFHLPLVVEI